MPLSAFLAMLVVLCVLLDNQAAVKASALLLANWAVNTWIAEATGSQFNWAAMSFVDFATAAVLIAGARPTRAQILVACIYAYELVAHASRALGPMSDYTYWYALHYGAWAQAWVIAGWGGYDGCKRVWCWLGAGRSRSNPPHLVGAVDRCSREGAE
jgi:hypothetical protein